MKFAKYDENISTENRKFGDIAHLIALALKDKINN